MIRIVAAANVLVSAAITRDASSEPAVILEAAFDGRVELVTSPQLHVEIGAVPTRRRMGG